jgi:hypothetical protein
VGFNHAYLDKGISNSIKGIFILIVFYRHFSQYATINGWLDKPFIWINSHISQLLVAMFLFYSGYGVATSIEKGGCSYIQSMPLKRILITLLNFDLAVMCYMALGWIMGKHYEKSTILLSFIGWKSVGNSNWYIYVIISLYILIWISFVFFYRNRTLSIIFLGVLCVGFVSFLSLYQEKYFYNTIFCFFFGVVYAVYRQNIEKVIFNNAIWIIFLLDAIFGVYYLYSYFNLGKNIVLYELWAIIFTCTVILITMKLHIENNILRWLGENLFGLYIMQRIPLIVLQHLELNVYIYFWLSLAITILLGYGFNRLVGIIDKKLLDNLKMKD